MRDRTERPGAGDAALAHMHQALLAVIRALGTSLEDQRLLDVIGAAIRGIIPFDQLQFAGGYGEPERVPAWLLEGADLVPRAQARTLDVSTRPLLLQMMREDIFIRVDEPGALANHPASRKRMIEDGMRSAVAISLRGTSGWRGGLSFASRELAAYAEVSEQVVREVAQTVGAVASFGADYQAIRSDRDRLSSHNEYLRGEVEEAFLYEGIIGRSASMRAVIAAIDVVGPTDAPVLISGETGTGKELVARAIHRVSTRKDELFVKMNCAAIPESLAESELFGHARGAFTGADQARKGRFEVADGGSLFLDEVGDLPQKTQGALLAVLENGAYERVGEDRTRTVDVRLVSATNIPLEEAMEQKRFRSDLFYRLNVYPIVIAPLRERREDIAPLTHHFLAQVARRLRRPVPDIAQSDMSRLEAYAWPGNARELQSTLERAMISSPDGLPLDIYLPTDTRIRGAAERVFTDREFKDLERENLLAALERTGWKLGGEAGAAALLGLKPTTLSSRMKKMEIRRP